MWTIKLGLITAWLKLPVQCHPMFETADGTGEMARRRKWSWGSKGKIETIKLMKPEIFCIKLSPSWCGMKFICWINMPLLVSWIDNKIWSSRPVEGGSSSNANIPCTQKIQNCLFERYNIQIVQHYQKKSQICPQTSHLLRSWRRYQFFLHQSMRVPARKKTLTEFRDLNIRIGWSALWQRDVSRSLFRISSSLKETIVMAMTIVVALLCTIWLSL